MSDKTLLIFINTIHDPSLAEYFILEKRPFCLTKIVDIRKYNEKPSRVVGILSASMVTAFVREIPKRQRKYLSRTLPFLLEDDLIMPLESQHLVSQAVPDNKVRAIAVNHELMGQISSDFDDYSPIFNELYVDADLIDLPAGSHCRIIRSDDRYLLKMSDGLIASMDSLAELDDLEGVSVNDVEHVEAYQQFCAEAIDAHVANLPPINLLQGLYEAKSTRVKRSELVHRVIFISAIILTLQVCYWIYAGTNYKNNSEILKKQSIAQYRGYFPDEKTLIDIRTQAEGHLSRFSSSKDAPSFIYILEQLGGVVEQNFAANQVRVNSIEYQKDLDNVIVEIITPDIASIELIQEALTEGNQLSVVIEQINQREKSIQNSESAVTSRLRILNAKGGGG